MLLMTPVCLSSLLLRQETWWCREGTLAVVVLAPMALAAALVDGARQSAVWKSSKILEIDLSRVASCTACKMPDLP